ncbi:MAG: hypothetical protein MHM6MM_000563 [Cercozoa sp. M6MM]
MLHYLCGHCEGGACARDLWLGAEDVDPPPRELVSDGKCNYRRGTITTDKNKTVGAHIIEQKIEILGHVSEERHELFDPFEPVEVEDSWTTPMDASFAGVWWSEDDTDTEAESIGDSIAAMANDDAVLVIGFVPAMAADLRVARTHNSSFYLNDYSMSDPLEYNDWRRVDAAGTLPLSALAPKVLLNDSFADIEDALGNGDDIFLRLRVRDGLASEHVVVGCRNSETYEMVPLSNATLRKVPEFEGDTRVCSKHVNNVHYAPAHAAYDLSFGLVAYAVLLREEVLRRCRPDVAGQDRGVPADDGEYTVASHHLPADGDIREAPTQEGAAVRVQLFASLAGSPVTDRKITTLEFAVDVAYRSSHTPEQDDSSVDSGDAFVVSVSVTLVLFAAAGALFAAHVVRRRQQQHKKATGTADDTSDLELASGSSTPDHEAAAATATTATPVLPVAVPTPAPAVTGTVVGAAAAEHFLVDSETLARQRRRQRPGRRPSEKPMRYACHLCERAFARRYNLKRHLKTHLTTRPWMCARHGCQRRFADRSSCRAHMLTCRDGNEDVDDNDAAPVRVKATDGASVEATAATEQLFQRAIAYSEQQLRQRQQQKQQQQQQQQSQQQHQLQLQQQRQQQLQQQQKSLHTQSSSHHSHHSHRILSNTSNNNNNNNSFSNNSHVMHELISGMLSSNYELSSSLSTMLRTPPSQPQRFVPRTSFVPLLPSQVLPLCSLCVSLPVGSRSCCSCFQSQRTNCLRWPCMAPWITLCRSRSQRRRRPYTQLHALTIH